VHPHPQPILYTISLYIYDIIDMAYSPQAGIPSAGSFRPSECSLGLPEEGKKNAGARIFKDLRSTDGVAFLRRTSILLA
ncbi:hypothetical protein DP142_25675, partial [Salmonella enterica subsp. enterica serovar Typhimurium]